MCIDDDACSILRQLGAEHVQPLPPSPLVSSDIQYGPPAMHTVHLWVMTAFDLVISLFCVESIIELSWPVTDLPPRDALEEVLMLLSL